jgi:hypothetical protein
VALDLPPELARVDTVEALQQLMHYADSNKQVENKVSKGCWRGLLAGLPAGGGCWRGCLAGAAGACLLQPRR